MLHRHFISNHDIFVSAGKIIMELYFHNITGLPTITEKSVLLQFFFLWKSKITNVYLSWDIINMKDYIFYPKIQDFRQGIIDFF